MKGIVPIGIILSGLLISCSAHCQIAHPEAAIVRKKRINEAQGGEGSTTSRFPSIEQVRGFLRKMPNKVMRHEDQFFLVNENGDKQPLVVLDSTLKTRKHLFYIGSFRDLQSGKTLKAYIEN